MKRLLLTFTVAALCTSPALASGIRGWGPWQFGMSIEQAQQAVDRKASLVRSTNDPRLTTLGQLFSIGGVIWQANASFTDGDSGGIWAITLSAPPKISIEECKSRFAAAQAAYQQKFGALDVLPPEARSGYGYTVSKLSKNFDDGSSFTLGMVEKSGDDASCQVTIEFDRDVVMDANF